LFTFQITIVHICNLQGSAELCSKIKIMNSFQIQTQEWVKVVYLQPQSSSSQASSLS